MTEIVTAVAAKVSEYLVTPIGRQLSYLFCYRSNIDELINKVQELGHMRGDLQITVDEAIRRGDEIRPIVNDWLSRADGITGEAEKLMNDENKSCFNWWCPNLKSRYQLSREAKQKTQVIVQIIEARKFPDGVSYRVPAKNVAFKNYEAFESRATTLNKVMEALRDDKMKMIGVWGMGGVGKTTLVKQVHKLAQDDRLFGKVVMVPVSREQNLGKIQSDIAYELGLKFEENESGRASQLSERLKKEKTVLIILDDIWKKLDLEAVGIPHGEDHKGCKIVVTSRSIDVLSQDMDTQPNFEIRILSDDEAWQLFQNTAGGIPDDVQSVAREVAEKCGGLPVALVTVAKALKNKSLPCWKDALRQLKSPDKTDIRGMDKYVYKSIELSYDSLEIEDAKSLFLLCGLASYGDVALDLLFKWSLGLGLFQSIRTLDESTYRLQVLVDSLKSSSLLLDSDKEYVRMHDVVRDIARQLAYKDPCRFVVKEATNSEIHESASYIPLSLSHEGTLNLGERLDRPKIEFFLSVNYEGSLKIPDPFFNGMGNLKVLHLFQRELSPLPLSLQSLVNLRTLCLHCSRLGDVAGIGGLKKLEVLSFGGSNIVQLPREIAQLTSLRWLDLRNCRQLQVIPPNILSNLSQLEHLYMKSSKFTRSEDEEINQKSTACLAELKHLSRLTTLNIALQDLELLPKDMVFEKLTRFKIFIGCEWDLASPCETKRALKLNDVNRSLHLVDGISKLLKKTEELSLTELSGTKSVFHESDEEDFLQLQHLNVVSSPEIQYIVDSWHPGVQEYVLFPKLESLLLDDLINLETVCHGLIPKGSFGNLKTLKVSKCHELKIFLPLIMATGFLHLQNIEIGECNVMQQIIAYERESENSHDGTTLQLFSKLQSLSLWELPELMKFSSKLEATSSTSLTSNARSEGNCDIHMSFFSHQVLFPNLENLELYNLSKLKGIWHHQLSLDSFSNLQILKVTKCSCLLNLISCHLIQNFKNLKEIQVSDCEVLKHVFDFQGLDENVEILPKLETLKLKRLHRLKSIIYNGDKNDSMRYLFSSPRLMDFQNLKHISINDCAKEDEKEGHFNTLTQDIMLFGEKVSFSNLEKLKLKGLPRLKEIWHHQLQLQLPLEFFYNNLQILIVHNCPCLVNLVPSYLIQSFGNLKEINVQDCGVLEHVFDLQRLDRDVEILPKLKILNLWTVPRLRHIICNEDKKCLFFPSTSKDFQSLKEVHVQNKTNVNTSTTDAMLFNEKASFLNGDSPMEHLPPGEAWSLFKKTAGDSVEENLQLRSIAIQVVEECEGLPIAIVTIAKALKDESVDVWENALEQLRSCAVGKKVYSCLEWSYTHLKGDDVKSLFLLCGMLGYGDISLDHLLQYGMGLDLFDRIDSLEEARNRLLALLELLKASGLLLDSHEDEHNFDEERDSSLLFMDADNKFVRMHDVVYDVAREIASKDPHPFVVREDIGLEEWSETDESKRCTFISLNCKAVPELPHGLVCPELQFFLLHNNNPFLNIPNTFFDGMKNLKVLDLSEMPFTTLPSSLDSLANLRTLRLDGCELVDFALIGKLTKLEVLSLVGSTIHQLPNEMVQLTNLRLLDLNYCDELEVIPRNILSSLSRLECLYMNSSFTQWAVEGESNACLSELNHLSHLTTLEIYIPDDKLLPKDSLFENLTRYAISIGDRWWIESDWKTKRALKLKGVDMRLYMGDEINKLLERSEELEFKELSGTQYVLHPSNRESFLELKHLRVSSSPDIQYIIDSKDLQFPQHGTFPLHNLEEVWHDPIPTGPFSNLKTLHVSSCDGLKFLFLPSTARGLSQLEEMEIEHCDAMQSIIAYERASEIKEDGHVGTNLQLFPKLQSLKLNNLPQLINFSSELETSSTSLSTNARSEGSFFNHQVSFPKLEELELIDLPKLKDIWHHQLPFGSFCNLQILRVYSCSCLLNLVPSHLIQNFKNLKEIDVEDCKLLEHVVILQEIDENVEILPKLETLNLEDLPKLRWIEDGNDNMKYISSPVTLMNIQNLKELHIINCRMEDW